MTKQKHRESSDGHFVAPYDASISFDELPDSIPPSRYKPTWTGWVGITIFSFWVFIAIFGQYLAPSPRHLAVDRFPKPERYDEWSKQIEEMEYIKQIKFKLFICSICSAIDLSIDQQTVSRTSTQCICCWFFIEARIVPAANPDVFAVLGRSPNGLH